MRMRERLKYAMRHALCAMRPCLFGASQSFPKVIGVGLRDSDHHPIAWLGLPFEKDASIDLRGLGPEPSS